MFQEGPRKYCEIDWAGNAISIQGSTIAGICGHLLTSGGFYVRCQSLSQVAELLHLGTISGSRSRPERLWERRIQTWD
eukprot:7352918-Pyramimonas_sp.AAC.2